MVAVWFWNVFKSTVRASGAVQPQGDAARPVK